MMSSISKGRRAGGRLSRSPNNVHGYTIIRDATRDEARWPAWKEERLLASIDNPPAFGLFRAPARQGLDSGAPIALLRMYICTGMWNHY